jgi:hypothetical protein
MGDNHNIIIKPYWLLGFMEGEGCFSIKKQVKSLAITPSFILSQTLVQKPVMVAIQTFLKNFEPNSLAACCSESKVKLIVQEINIYKPKAKPTIRVYVTDFSFIRDYLIPFLDNLVFVSIKELDYLDWKSAIKIKALKKHLTEEGSAIIKLIISRMNTNRRSTAALRKSSSNAATLNINNLDAKISKLLLPPALAGGAESISYHPVYIPWPTKPIQVWVYDRGELLNGSPFLSISHCVKSLKHLGFTNHINNIKDTGNLYKGRYTFYTKPL